MTIALTTKQPDALRHEDFCLPRPGLSEPRTESFPYYADDEKGRSRITHHITRCLECGVSKNKQIGL